MLSSTPPPGQPAPWQTELSRAVTDPQELLDLLRLDPGAAPGAPAAARSFPLRVPRGFIDRMRPGDPADPLLRQVLPLGEECRPAEGFQPDPVGDMAAMTVPGVLHKYEGRVLLIAAGTCAVNCRYCFRREFPYAQASVPPRRRQEALSYIEADDSIHEVILSGGDPLLLGDASLEELVHGLEGIPHVRRLRIHTRLPVVLPERINTALLLTIGATRLQVVVVVHANHANEISLKVAGAFAGLKKAGATLFNQAVLLRGVNDSAAALAELSEVLFASGVTPYYLHLLDRVNGAAHFEVPEAEAARIMQELAARLPGYMVPRLVREVPGALAKRPV